MAGRIKGPVTGAEEVKEEEDQRECARAIAEAGEWAATNNQGLIEMAIERGGGGEEEEEEEEEVTHLEIGLRFHCMAAPVTAGPTNTFFRNPSSSPPPRGRPGDIIRLLLGDEGSRRPTAQRSPEEKAAAKLGRYLRKRKWTAAAEFLKNHPAAAQYPVPPGNKAAGTYAIHHIYRRRFPPELLLQILELSPEQAINSTAGRRGMTPLQIAACKDNALCVRVLIERGADVNALDVEGRTVLDLLHSQEEIVAALQNAHTRT